MEHLYLPGLGSAASALRIGVERSSHSNLLQHKGSVNEEAWASTGVNEVLKVQTLWRVLVPACSFCLEQMLGVGKRQCLLGVPKPFKLQDYRRLIITIINHRSIRMNHVPVESNWIKETNRSEACLYSCMSYSQQRTVWSSDQPGQIWQWC